ncbi:methylamine utilization protein [Methylorubrum extorquens]|jgi:plastocyanin|uniref:methylamine utilization protein n=1 Tax=Methylorubrum extorquens TaxID=408 RepID=UPI001EE56869|nr:methylamine utilization protein [Methylorubrum extorquens]MCG5249366.1 methylamine utilization protein [Methylorubrum extorquens]
MVMSTMLRVLTVSLAFAVNTYASPAAADEFEVTIHHVELQDPGLKAKVGDAITFVNHADISHNLYLTYEDGRVETLDTQPPRTTKRTVLKQAGHVVVRCWIHPIIRMEFDVAAK